jgi:hypothetical protein
MKITYVTYQGIPSYNTYAYGICTFSTIKYLRKNSIDVDLIFPLREKNATTDVNELKRFYEIDEDFVIKATKHFLPFGRVKFLEKYMYISSHILWSFYVANKIAREKDLIVFTLSDWVFYFLSRKGKNVVYECHDLTNLRKKLVKNAMKSKNSKIICINKFIKEDLKLESENNVIVLENGYEQDFFSNSNKKDEKIKIIFSGNLQRFGKSRGVEEIIDYFINSKFYINAELHIFGGPPEYSQNLKQKFKNQNIHVHGHTTRKELSKVLSSAHVGIMCNIESTHAERHTSPVKYYEYLGSGMVVVATNSKAHELLPYQDQIYYFDLDSKSSFLNALENALDHKEEEKPSNVDSLSLEHRINKVINFINARPEGLEPSTP